MANDQAAQRLFCFGLGYSALALAGVLGGGAAQGRWRIAGTCRRAEPAVELDARDLATGIEVFGFDGTAAIADAGHALEGATHMLISIPPGPDGDVVLNHHGDDIAALAGRGTLQWLGYLSTTAVYGDHDGGWVDETTPPAHGGERGRRRLAAEQGWLALGRNGGVPVHIFRLAGIYGPGRSILDRVRTGTARNIHKPGQVFSRIHVDDIVAVLKASMACPRPGAIYNVCDDAPAPPDEVLRFACDLLGRPPPPPESLATAGLSAMARSFYDDNKRVSNRRIKTELGVCLSYPDYRSGLRALAARD